MQVDSSIVFFFLSSDYLILTKYKKKMVTLDSRWPVRKGCILNDKEINCWLVGVQFKFNAELD